MNAETITENARILHGIGARASSELYEPLVRADYLDAMKQHAIVQNYVALYGDGPLGNTQYHASSFACEVSSAKEVAGFLYGVCTPYKSAHHSHEQVTRLRTVCETLTAEGVAPAVGNPSDSRYPSAPGLAVVVDILIRLVQTPSLSAAQEKWIARVCESGFGEYETGNQTLNLSHAIDAFYRDHWVMVHSLYKATRGGNPFDADYEVPQLASLVYGIALEYQEAKEMHARKTDMSQKNADSYTDYAYIVCGVGAQAAVELYEPLMQSDHDSSDEESSIVDRYVASHGDMEFYPRRAEDMARIVNDAKAVAGLLYGVCTAQRCDHGSAAQTHLLRVVCKKLVEDMVLPALATERVDHRSDHNLVAAVVVDILGRLLQNMPPVLSAEQDAWVVESCGVGFYEYGNDILPHGFAAEAFYTGEQAEMVNALYWHTRGKHPFNADYDIPQLAHKVYDVHPSVYMAKKDLEGKKDDKMRPVHKQHTADSVIDLYDDMVHARDEAVVGWDIADAPASAMARAKSAWKVDGVLVEDEATFQPDYATGGMHALYV